MKSKLAQLGKPTLSRVWRVKQRRQRWEVVSTILMIIVMMLLARTKRSGPVTRTN